MYKQMQTSISDISGFLKNESELFLNDSAEVISPPYASSRVLQSARLSVGRLFLQFFVCLLHF